MSNHVFTPDQFRRLDRNLLNFHVFSRTVDGMIAIRTVAPAQPGATHNFFTEKGNPNAGQGNPGDMYLNIDTLDLFGPKTGSGWGPPVSLKSDGGKVLIETTASGSDSYEIPGEATLEDKLMVPFISDVYNEGPATLDYNGLGPKPIVDIDGNPLCNLDIKAKRLVFTKYDQANDQFVLLDPSIETYKTLDSFVIEYNITNGLIDRDYDANLTSVDEFMDLIYTLVDDLYVAGLFTDVANNCAATSVAQTWITNNVSGLRTFDAKNTSMDILADVFGTLISDLKNGNLFNGSPLQKTNQTYTVTNSTIDIVADADTTSIDESANLLGTVIEHLKGIGIIS